MARGWAIKGKLTGVAQAVQSLEKYKQGIRSRVLRKAITKAAQPLTKDAKRRVGLRTKQLKKSIGYRVKVYRTTGNVFAAIGPRQGFRSTYLGKPVDPIKYAHIHERGRRAVRVKKARVLAEGTKAQPGRFFGQSVGPAAGRWFLTRAWNAGKRDAERTIVREIAAGHQWAAAQARAGKKVTP